jgi:hypothetical protein
MAVLTLGILALLSISNSVAPSSRDAPRWSETKANEWYGHQGWLVGCNFIPSTAINELEMWQADTFDLPTIDRELGWAHGIGMNTARIFLHDLAWSQDPKGFKHRLDEVLGVAKKHHIKPMLVLFDSCWNPDPKIGKQPESVVGVHNGGWLQCPGAKSEQDPTSWPALRQYVQDIVHSFRNDSRVLMWDVYNEPRKEALPLLKESFQWVREAKPSQPISSGVFGGDAHITEFQLLASDVTTCHQYGDATALTAFLDSLPKGRPVICTEWMARSIGSRVQTNLPIFKERHVGCLNWGLVYGKTQTIYPWGSKPGAPEPNPWFHDLFRKDGTPFDPKEIHLFRALTGTSE